MALGCVETEVDQEASKRRLTEPTVTMSPSFAVQECAVGRAQVVDHETAAGAMDLGMVAAGVAVVDHDPAVGEPADQVAPVAELDAVTGRHHDRARTPARLALLDLGRDAEPAGLERVVDAQVDDDGAHEVVALFAGVLAHGLDELGAERVLDVGEPGVVVGGEQDMEIVGHDALAFDVDGAVIIHLADEAAPELDRPDGVAGTAEHAIDHTL
jgi:hypothetical protein